jgi:hypothetical protein
MSELKRRTRYLYPSDTTPITEELRNGQWVRVPNELGVCARVEKAEEKKDDAPTRDRFELLDLE